MAAARTPNATRSLINILTDLPPQLPTEFDQTTREFIEKHQLTPPAATTGNGKAFIAMCQFPNRYFDRETASQFCQRYGIPTKDSIQLFNKHSQWGPMMSQERGKYYIQFPLTLSPKVQMRAGFKWDGTEEQKTQAIETIKADIKTDYVDIPNEQWQLGHKNPEGDNTSNNLVLQPPIQAKYRDNYIFIDTLTKIPTPETLARLIQDGRNPYTPKQMQQLRALLNSTVC